MNRYQHSRNNYRTSGNNGNSGNNGYHSNQSNVGGNGSNVTSGNGYYNGGNKSFMNKFQKQVNTDNKENSNPINSYVKQQIIKYIYDTIDISRFKYKILEYEYDLVLLKDNKYFVSPNYNGTNGLLVFIKLKDRFYSVIIDRRTLSYSSNLIDLEKVKIIPINIRLESSIYNGTIMDGILLYNTGNKKTFIINDIYYFEGSDMSLDNINHKLLNVATYFENNTKDDPILNDTILLTNKVYDIAELKKLINNYIPKSKLSSSIKGIAFYPEKSSTKLIYLYNNCSTGKDDIVPNLPINMSSVIKPVRTLTTNHNNSIVGFFRIKKTDTVDVYNLYLVDIEKKDNKKIARYKKYCLAYLPSTECSQFCKDIFDKVGSDVALVECKYIADKDKWLPFRHVTDRKLPSDISEIQKLLSNTS